MSTNIIRSTKNAGMYLHSKLHTLGGNLQAASIIQCSDSAHNDTMKLVGLISKLVLPTWGILQRHGLFFHRRLQMFFLVDLEKKSQRWYLGYLETVDGRNLAKPVDMVDIPIVYRLLYIPGGCLGFLPSTVWISVSASEQQVSLVAFCINVVIPAPWALGLNRSISDSENMWNGGVTTLQQLVSWSLIHTWWDFLNAKTLIGCA